MNTIIEVLFCPQHGLFSATNLPLISAVVTSLRDNLTAIYSAYRFKQMRDNGAF